LSAAHESWLNTGMMFRLLMFCVLSLSRPVAVHADVFADEEAYKDSKYKADPAAQQRELDLVLPAFPRSEGLIDVPLDSPDFPYSLWIDPESLSVGEDRVVRFTAVLRSPAGAETVSYEGILCDQRRYKRYAYGNAGEFRTLPAPDWVFIRNTRQDIFRAVLTDSYFCPLPGRDNRQLILNKLQNARLPGSPQSQYDE
jgi:hypothetical protein